MDIQIDNQQTIHLIGKEEIRKKAKAILNALDCPDGELSIVIVDDAKIADLNEAYLHHTGPTNVISFPMREGEYSDINPNVLGDVVISAQTCAREAEEGGIPVQDRFDQLLIHGILHLFGYDHIHSRTQARMMGAKSRELIAMLERMDSNIQTD